ncbi:benzoate 4-monooxygenase cytochrome p450 [Hyaloscypha variabilis F]|uniref:Benzoate 4-monooxygenase cytochrome p450 n=1 Tax=Hyaloscypha variabilis (strain UAMH 11265 / GT02V1 / F) TaxID=1149755 RepID=A0A2J6RQQ6_HYAVF|nr:benzoate 4-monooxygenase cytochrome p450 [Hyaloscypha variabilis F]
MELSMSTLFFFSLGGVFLGVLAWIWYITFAHPLSSVPNASFLAPISRLLWALPSEYQGQITLDLPRLHEVYGPLVRIGPNEVSFYSLDIYKAVHSVRSPFAKDPRVYGQFVQDAHPALFSITDAFEHSQRRRLMGQLFNQSKMNALEGMMTQHISAFVHALEQRISQPIEVVRACRALEADIVSAFGFGEQIGAIGAWENGEDLNMIKANDEKSKIIALCSSFPTLASVWDQAKAMLYNVTGWQSKSTSALKDFDQRKWSANQLTRLLTPKTAPQAHPNFISTMLASRLPAPSALSEAKEMLGPGTDTTSATLAHILWALAHDISYQDALVQDLMDAQWPNDMSSLESIPRLRAAVKEGIRWTGAAAAMLPRVVPEGGCTLAGTFIPGGTVISSSPIWYLHDKTAFPEPKLYRPSRWLNDESRSDEQVKLRDDFYIPFSKGSSACIGIHFAYFELFLSLSKILQNFQVTLPPTPAWPVIPREARLPERLEWVAAVPTVDLNVLYFPRGLKR